MVKSDRQLVYQVLPHNLHDIETLRTIFGQFL